MFFILKALYICFSTIIKKKKGLLRANSTTQTYILKCDIFNFKIKYLNDYLCLMKHDKIYSTLSRDYRNKLVIQHFYHKDANVPIWAIFEVLSLGEFGNFITCLKQPTRKLISMSLGINQAFDTNSILTGSIIYAIKDLRNAVAHNDVIFDTRFNTSKINDTLSSALHQDCKMKNINFKTVTDYVILVCFILKQMGVSKSEILGMINNYIDITENLRGKIPVKIYSKIIHTDTRNKLESIKQYAFSLYLEFRNLNRFFPWKTNSSRN